VFAEITRHEQRAILDLLPDLRVHVSPPRRSLW